MKIGFVSPYLDSLAGGERYVLTLASHWSRNHDVSVFWDDSAILSKAEKRLNIDLTRTHTVENVFATRNIFRKMIVSRGYDVLFFVTDGSIPTTFAKHNLLHFQVPFGLVRVHAIKLRRFDRVICNSQFTKRNIDARLGKGAAVIYPPVAPVGIKNRKKKMILSVGRFHPLKKQDVIIEAIRRLEGYELVLAGGLLPADKEYYRRLQFAAKNLPVRLVPNPSYAALKNLYNEAVVYWHAAGYRATRPEDAEHFGISTVEAMSAGAVPVVYNGGGLPEIVREGQDGYLWANTDDLIFKTKKVLADPRKFSPVSRAKAFSREKFERAFDGLLTEIIR